MEFLVLLKRECETCQLVGPLLAELKGRLPLTLYAQDDPAFPEAAGGSRDDTVERAAGLFLGGRAIDWDQLYPRDRFRKVEIPGYPFANRREGDAWRQS